MEGTFTLRIELGNDAACCAEDIAEMLRDRVLPVLDDGVHAGDIRDLNGNYVGEFNVERTETAEDRHLAELRAIGYREDSLAPLLELEDKAHSDAEAYCSVEGFDYETAEAETERQVAELFGGELPDGFFVNGDPRGYALKLSEGTGSISHRDWGGYEILAPDFS